MREYAINPNSVIKIYPFTPPKNEKESIHGYFSRIKIKDKALFLNFNLEHVKDKPPSFSLQISNKFTPSFPLELRYYDIQNNFLKNKPTMSPEFLNSIPFKDNNFFDVLAGKINKRYIKNKDLLKSSNKTSDLLIPLIIHTFWPETPTNLENHLNWFKTSLDSCNTANGWSHIIWVNKKTPDNTQLLDKVSTSNFVIKEIAEITIYDKDSSALINDFIVKNQQDSAELLLRYVLLETMGGVFRRLNCEIEHDLLEYNRSYDFYSGLEITTRCCPDTAILASRPSHPLIKKAKEFLIDSVKNDRDFLKKIPSNVDAPLAMALFEQKDEGENNDIIVPPFIFGLKAQKGVVDSTDPKEKIPAIVMAYSY